MMTLTIGHAGWVRLVDDDLPGPLYARCLRDERGRWNVSEVYLDGRGAVLTAEMFRRLPLGPLEAWVNEAADEVESKYDRASAVDLSTMASAYSTSFGAQADPRRDWLAMAYFASFDADVREQEGLGDLVRPKRIPGPRRPRADSSYRLTEGPGPDGLTDAFLARVGRAYAAAMLRGERPNKAIARDCQHAVKTVQRWVYEARKRGVMPPARQGTQR